MKTKHYFLLAILAAVVSVISIDRVRNALFFDTKIAYSEATLTYVYGTDGSEHLAVHDFYPHTRTFRPSEWGGSFGIGYSQLQANLNMNKKALNECLIMETSCEESTNNLCPLVMTGLAVVTPDNQVIPVWNNPF